MYRKMSCTRADTFCLQTWTNKGDILLILHKATLMFFKLVMTVYLPNEQACMKAVYLFLNIFWLIFNVTVHTFTIGA